MFALFCLFLFNTSLTATIITQVKKNVKFLTYLKGNEINEVSVFINVPRDWNMQGMMNIKGKEGACGNVPEI